MVLDQAQQAKFVQHGVSQEHLEHLERSGLKLNWSALFMLAGKYGPGIVADLGTLTWVEIYNDKVQNL